MQIRRILRVWNGYSTWLSWMLVSLSDACLNSDDYDDGGSDSMADIDEYEREVDENG